MNYDISDGNYSHLYPTQKEFVSSGVPFLRANNISKNTISDTDMRFISKDKHKILKKGQLKKGDLLFTNRGVIGQVGIIPDKYIGANINAQIVRINSGNITTNRYLMYVFLKQEMKNQMKKLETGSTLKQLPIKKLGKLEIPIPPIPQQEKIVKVLDISSQLIEKQKELIADYDLFLKSKFIEMFGDPIKNPMGWEVVKTQDITDFLTSGSRGWAKYYSEKGEVFIRIQNVKNGNITFTEKQYINAPFTQEAKRTKVKENDLLLSITADLGRTGVVSKSLESQGAYISQHLALLRLKEGFSAIYVSAFIETISGKLQFEKLNQGGTKAGLNFNAINSFKLFNPPIDLQNKFASIVEKIEIIKKKETKKLKHLEILHKSLMDKVFKGEIS